MSSGLRQLRNDWNRTHRKIKMKGMTWTRLKAFRIQILKFSKRRCLGGWTVGDHRSSSHRDKVFTISHTENGDPAYDVPGFHSQSLQSREDAHRAAQAVIQQQTSRGGKSKSSKVRWHFGIRSRSPPMEVMHEIYKTLQQLGMQWKRKPDFVDEHGRPVAQTSQRDKRAKDKQNEINQGLYFVETRCKIDDVVVRILTQGSTSNVDVPVHS